MERVKPEPVKPVVGIFSADETLLTAVAGELARWLGEPDYESPLLAFEQTRYYEREMGPGLKRRFYAFPRLIDAAELVALKRWAIETEARWQHAGRRRVNVDPGYVSLAKLVLATTKDNVHRIYLGEGIYAEVTLYFRRGRFHPWPWTYPDYASLEYRAIFEHIRELYREQLRAAKQG
ncbi:DUF4416 family protein [Thermodesulfitimonas sp.]